MISFDIITYLSVMLSEFNFVIGSLTFNYSQYYNYYFNIQTSEI